MQTRRRDIKVHMRWRPSAHLNQSRDWILKSYLFFLGRRLRRFEKRGLILLR
jgi:hypothetical protein